MPEQMTFNQARQLCPGFDPGKAIIQPNYSVEKWESADGEYALYITFSKERPDRPAAALLINERKDAAIGHYLGDDTGGMTSCDRSRYIEELKVQRGRKEWGENGRDPWSSAYIGQSEIGANRGKQESRKKSRFVIKKITKKVDTPHTRG